MSERTPERWVSEAMPTHDDTFATWCAWRKAIGAVANDGPMTAERLAAILSGDAQKVAG